MVPQTAPLAVPFLAAMASAIAIPANVQDFYNSIVAQGKCNDPIASGFYSIEGDAGSEFPSQSRC
jgi:hypothetical protein